MSKGNVDLPCLITPDLLHFNAKKTERGSPQVITIFNHYDFAIYYKILSTSPQLYTIGSTQGMINPVSSMEITIELKEDAARLMTQETVQDKFKIEVTDINGTATHKKIIKATTTAAQRSPVTTSKPPQLSDYVDVVKLKKTYASLARIAPLVLGVILLFLISPSDNILVTMKFWFAFFIGLSCMYFYNRLSKASNV
eukprot:Phypoly_transcript_17168.p1 GENE.Phypoly_transcript_17168~~Phypoly_transcript_17168.p1  ORF type:complete len:197 (+),score=26.67 Phypoly_transcript_17168:186-776(+)